MRKELPLPALDTLDEYRRLFTDVSYWSPYVQEIIRRHGLSPSEPIRTGIPGTCPVFIVGERWVVKFFGKLFDGARAFAAEREAGRLVKTEPAIRTARMCAWGELGEEEWPWPYLVFDYIDGISFGEARENLLPEDELRAARKLGETVRQMHALPLTGSPVFPHSHQPYLRFLAGQREGVTDRQREWGRLPAALIDQIETFLPPVEELVNFTRLPHLIHADLTGDHLLGRFFQGHWESLAIIDFGDAMTGDLLYELAALHLDMFRGDSRLLSAFLDAYEYPPEKRPDLPRKALATALLHQFNVFEAVPDERMQAASLEELAQALWNI